MTRPGWTIATVLLLGASMASAADWNRFRGPNGTGVAEDKDIPIQWTEKNIHWKTALPGKGHSSPIISKGKIFLQSSSNDQKQRFLICLDANKGTILWQKEFTGGPAKTHAKNTPGSNTPAADATQIYAVFWDGSNQHLTAWDYDGAMKWKVDLGPFKSQHGSGMSPIIVGDKVIVNNDQDGKAEVIAFDSKSGKEVWRKARDPERACYSTPFILEKTDSGPDLIVASTGGITAYDPKDGKELWNYKWTFDKMRLRTVASPLFYQGIVYAASGDGGGDRNMIAVKLGGSGDITSTNLVWQKKKGTPYVPCLLAHNGLIFWVTDKENLAVCVDAKTGEERFSERLAGDQVSASPVLVNGNIYTINEKGVVCVFAAEATFKLLAKYDLKEQVYASPAVANGKMYIRGVNHLFCIGK